MDITFEWDPAKAAANEAKHGIAFEEAETVFSDPLASWGEDPGHYRGEERFTAIGLSYRQRLVLVVFTERGGKVRIISARKPSRHEARSYAG